MVALQCVPITEHERRFVVFAQVLCVGHNYPYFSRLSPAGVPVGRRAASRRPEINITETRVVIRRHSENKNHRSMWSSTPTEFGNVVCLNENEMKNGSFFGTVKTVPYSVSEHRQDI